MSTIRLTHAPSGTILAEGPKGFGGITPFEGNFYIRRKYLRTDAFKANGVPGLCPYKFLYVWLDLKLEGREPSKYLGWLYWLPNPLGFYPARADTSEKAHLGPGGVSWQSEGSTARSLNVRRSG